MAGMNFNLNDLITAQSEQDRRRLAQEEAERNAQSASQIVESTKAVKAVDLLKRARGVNTAARAEADKALKAKDYLMKDAEGLAAIEEEAITLSNSPKDSDKMKLWFKQLTDPRYTREYNSSRQAKLMQSAGVIDTFNAAKQQAYARQLDALKESFDIESAVLDLSLLPVKQQFEVATLSKNQGDAAVQALTKAVQERTQTLIYDNTMQDQVLENQTADSVREAVAKAAADPNRVTNVGGVNISLGKLEKRQTELDDQEFLRQTRAAAAEDKVAAINKRVAERFAQTMSPGQLDRVIMSGGKIDLGDGKEPIALELDWLTKTRDLKKATQDQMISAEANLAGIADGRNMVTEHARVVERLPDVEPGTGLFNAKLAYQDLIRTSAGFLNTFKTKEELESPAFFDASRIIYDQLNVMRERMNKEIGVEAKRLSRGNAFMETIYKAKLSGESAPVEAVEAEVVNRVKSGKSVADIIGSEQNGLFLQDYSTELARIKAEAGMSGLSGLDADSGLQKQEAVAAAWQKMINRISTAETERGISLQVMDPTHPLHGKIPPQEFWAMEAQANTQGLNDFQRDHRMSPADYEKFLKGQDVNGLNVRTAGPIVATYQSSALFDSIAIMFGQETAEKTAAWWTTPDGAKFTKNFSQQLSRESISEPAPKYITKSLAAPKVESDLQAWGNFAQAGIQDYMKDRFSRLTHNFRAFGNDPFTFQLVALGLDDSLDDLDKQLVWQKFIQPVLSQEVMTGAKFEDVNRAIEITLRNSSPEAPEDKALLKRFLRSRQQAIGEIDRVIHTIPTDTSLWRGQTRAARGVRAYPGKLQWYSKMQDAQRGVNNVQP